MSKIRIHNFGPIKDGCLENAGWIDINKITIFIGNQGSGKSTVAKLISSFTWIEKALVRGDYEIKWFERANRLKNSFFGYHRIESYMNPGLFDNSTIEYIGEAYKILFERGSLKITEIKDNSYPLPQIMYVPAERNFLAYVKTPNELKLASDSLKEFLGEYDKAINSMKEAVALPINEVDVEYDKLNKVVNVKGKDYKVKLTDASSGFQSLVPLYLVSDHLAKSVRKQSESKESMSNKESVRFKKEVEKIILNENLTDEQQRIAISVLSSKFNKSAFVNIVEEPEQNLFPSSQWQLLKKLCEFNNLNIGNKLIITTHSPYIINYLSVAIQAEEIKKQIKTDSLRNKLNGIVPLESTVNASDVSIYQMNEKTGTISKLSDYEGIPSDKNYLNESLAEGNLLFDSLLEIEQEI